MKLPGQSFAAGFGSTTYLRPPLKPQTSSHMFCIFPSGLKMPAIANIRSIIQEVCTRYPALQQSPTDIKAVEPVLPWTFLNVNLSYPRSVTREARRGAEAFRPFWDTAPAQKTLGGREGRLEFIRFLSCFWRYFADMS